MMCLVDGMRELNERKTEGECGFFLAERDSGSTATANPATVPEPSSLLFSSAVLAGMIVPVRRRRQSKSVS